MRWDRNRGRRLQHGAENKKSPVMERRKALGNTSNLGTTDTACAADETVRILHTTKYVARRAL